MSQVFLEISPNIPAVLLPIVFAGIIGCLLCYAHRFLVFIVVPVFLIWCVYQINSHEFFLLVSGSIVIVYTTMILCLGAMSIGTTLSWKRYKKDFD